MKDWKLTVKDRMKELGISQEKLAEKINCTQGAVGHWLNGRRKADLETINTILKAIDLPPLGIGLVNTPINAASTQVSVYDEETPLEDDEIDLPLIKDIELSAGQGRIASSEIKTKAKIRFSKTDLIKQGVSFNYAVCVPVSGNSMEPVIPNKATVGIDTANTNIVDGKIYAVVIENELARVKQLYRLPNNKVRLRSFNRDEYEDEEYSLDDIRVVGKVFWSSVLWD